MRWLLFLLLLSWPVLAQEAQMGPVGGDHLKDGRFLFEWGSIDSPPGLGWTAEIGTPGDRWHYAALKLDRNHPDSSRACNLYVFPPEPLDAESAKGWFKLLLPEAQPPQFTRTSNPLRPSYWSPIRGRDFQGTMVLTATPQAVYCWEEIGKDKTPREFPRWLASFRPATQKRTFENAGLQISQQLPIQEGKIRVAAGQFTPPAHTAWVEAAVPSKQMEFYQGSRMADQALDVFCLAMLPESRRLSRYFLDGFLSGMGRSMGEKVTQIEVDTENSERIGASFQVGGIPGFAEARLTAGGTTIFCGFGPAVKRSEVVNLADSFQPSAEKIQESESKSRGQANQITLQIALWGAVLACSFSQKGKKRRLTWGLLLGWGVAILALANRMQLSEEGFSQVLGAFLGAGLVGVVMRKFKRPKANQNDPGPPCRTPAAEIEVEVK